MSKPQFKSATDSLGNRVTFKRAVTTRGRVYLHEDERDKLGIENPYNKTLEIVVTVADDYDDSSNWSLYNVSKGYVTMGEYGDFTIPKKVRDDFDIEKGDEIHVSATLI